MVESQPAGGVGGAALRFLRLLPALFVAMMILRAAELVAGVPSGTGAAATTGLAIAVLVGEGYVLLRHLPLLFLLSLPPLLLRSGRARLLGLGLLWSALLLLQAALMQYSLIARVPLGADLYLYSWSDIRQTVSGGFRLFPSLLVGTILAIVALWIALRRWLPREAGGPGPRTSAAIFAVALATLAFGPQQLPKRAAESADAYGLRLDKGAQFLDASVRYLLRPRAPAMARASANGAAGNGAIAGFSYRDPRYPFLHAERTPDSLGAYVSDDGRGPPNLVFVIVEGLGRSFSGPDAPLGSFTPFLDELAAKSLYWDNFLAAQGRTFAALPSIFGSLPYGAEGFAALGDAMPAHATLLSVLRANGYHLAFYAGTDLRFDNERLFLQRQGVDVLREAHDFGPRYARSNDWGYGDNELVSLALSDPAFDARPPFVTVLQTNSMHTPYTFNGQASYRRRFEQRLEELGIAADRRAAYRANRDIYTTILYSDDALRRFFTAFSARPAYGNTIFIITGDHRLPELPLAEWIDRYHVPLIIYSPLLSAPLRIRAVSSDFDIAPTLLAFLAHRHGLKTPARVTWIGSGLDLAPVFRNVHDFPMKQTKADLVDFVSGQWMLSRAALFRLGDGLHMEPVDQPQVSARVAARFAAFKAANDGFMQSGTLAPPGTFGQLVGYAARNVRAEPGALATPAAALTVTDLRAPQRARRDMLEVEAAFTNEGRQASAAFVPLAVLTAVDGRELCESYGAELRLAAGATAHATLPVVCARATAGHYFLSVLPSDPATGKPVGAGRFHVPIEIDD